MSIVMTANDSITAISAPTCFADVRVGTNNDPYGAAEYDVGNDAGATAGRDQWTSDLSGGFDTGAKNAEFAADAYLNNNATMWVQGGIDGAVTTGDIVFGSIDSVIVRVAAAGSGMETTWSGVTVKFYTHGVLTETDTLTSALDAQGQSTNPAEDYATVTPETSGCDSVVVTGSMRMKSTAIDYLPDVNDMFAQVLVFAS